VNLPDAVLLGGPHDGKIITHTKASHIETAFVMPEPAVIARPRPPWWRHPVRYFRWKLPPPPKPPELIQLRYTADGTMDAGRRVYRLASPWQSYRGPEACPQDGSKLHESLVRASYAVHPVIRQDPATRWVMSLDWWKQIRREAVSYGYGGDEGDDVSYGYGGDEGDEDDQVKPSPHDMVMGIRISVTADGGVPHLENPRYPQGWRS
jgi:hypothetical protein